MSRPVLATLALAELSTYSGAAVSSAPASNLKHPAPLRRMVVSGTTLDVKINLTDGLAATARTGISSYRLIGLIWSNCTETAIVEAFLGNTEGAVASAGSASYYDLLNFYRSFETDAALWPYRCSWIWLPSQRTEPWLRLKISDPANTTGAIELGLVIPHPGYQPTLPMKARPGVLLSQEAQELGAHSSSRYPQEEPQYEGRRFVLQAAGPTAEDEVHGEWLRLQRTVGMSKPVLAIMDPDATSRTMNEVAYGTLTGLQEIHLADTWMLSELEISIRELAARR